MLLLKSELASRWTRYSNLMLVRKEHWLQTKICC